MSLLEDKSLVENITGGTNPLVTNLQKRDDWYDAESPIQASSVDLHIGQIFLPGKTGKAEGSQDCPLSLHALQAGQTAIVSTLEDLHLPNHIAAIGFPPSRVSVQGLLMTNPGHVDPGYVGPMRFTVINMGKTDYVLRQKDPIVTLLFMKLVRSAEKDWLVRHNGRAGGPPTQKNLDVLSADFLDVQGRAETIAKTEVQSANIRLKRNEIWAGVVGAVVLNLFLGFSYWLSGLQEVKTKLAELEKSLGMTRIEQQMTDFDHRLKEIEEKLVTNPKPSTEQQKQPSTK